MQNRVEIGLIIPVRPLDLDDELPAHSMQNHIDLAVGGGQAHSIQIGRRRPVAGLLDCLLEALPVVGGEDAQHRRIEKLIWLRPDQLSSVGAGVRDASILQIGGNQRSVGLNSAGQVQLLSRAVGQRLRVRLRVGGHQIARGFAMTRAKFAPDSLKASNAVLKCHRSRPKSSRLAALAVRRARA